MKTLLSRLASVLAVGSVCTADVIVVHPTPGVGDHVEVQPAVDAAVDGDVVLIQPGSYAGFAVDGKAIVVGAAVPDEVYVKGIAIANLPAGSTCVLFGLRATKETVPGLAGLRIDAVSGLVLVERCRVQGYDGINTCQKSGKGAEIKSSSVVFVDSDVRAGNGCLCSGCGENGVVGMSIQASRVAFHRTYCLGGEAAGDLCHDWGDGGDAIDAVSSDLFFSDCTVIGGYGLGAGGSLHLIGGRAEWIATEFFSGYWTTCISSGPPSPQNPCAACPAHPGPARALTIANPSGGLLHEADIATFVAEGAPGDLAFAALSLDASLVWSPAAIGPFFVTQAFSLVTLGALPASGELAYPVVVAPLGAAEVTLTAQGAFLSSGGEVYLGPPVAAILLDPAY